MASSRGTNNKIHMDSFNENKTLGKKTQKEERKRERRKKMNQISIQDTKGLAETDVEWVNFVQVLQSNCVYVNPNPLAFCAQAKTDAFV